MKALNVELFLTQYKKEPKDRYGKFKVKTVTDN